MISRPACGKTDCRSESYYRLRKHHVFIKNTEELLAPAKAYLPENIPGPAGAEDMETLRAAFRYNEAADCGFLFINNHQRKRKMTEKQITPEKPLQFTVTDVEGIQRQIIFDRIHVRTDAILVLPLQSAGGNTGRAVQTSENQCLLSGMLWRNLLFLYG